MNEAEASYKHTNITVDWLAVINCMQNVSTKDIVQWQTDHPNTSRMGPSVDDILVSLVFL